MAARSKSKAKPGRGIDDAPNLVTHRTLARKMGVSTDSLREWCHRGEFPRPLAVVGATWLYREDHARAFLETGRWPEGMKYNRPATRRGIDGLPDTHV